MSDTPRERRARTRRIERGALVQAERRLDEYFAATGYVEPRDIRDLLRRALKGEESEERDAA